MVYLGIIPNIPSLLIIRSRLLLTFSPDGQTLASGSKDGTIKLWNWRTKELLHTLPEAAETPQLSPTTSPVGDILNVSSG